MANLRHLEEVVLLEERPYLHTVVRNTLYSLYRESATLEWMQNPDNLQRVNLPTMRLSNYNHFGEQLEKCRKILFPSRQDLIGMMLWLLKAATKMWTEGKALKLFDDEPQWAVEAFAELGEYAEANIQDLTRHFQPSKAIQADPNFAKYGGGVQQVKMLLDFMNLFPLEREHLDLVMAKDSTFDSLIDIIADLHHRKQQVQAGPYQSVNWTYLLWIDDMVGHTPAPAVPMQDPYIKVVDDTFRVNPPIGTEGQRRDEGGENPYIVVQDFTDALSDGMVAKEIAKVMIAYNLFDFANVWFKDYYEQAWSKLNFHSKETLPRCQTIGYRTELSRENFFSFVRDMNTLLGLEPRHYDEEELEPPLREGVPDHAAPPRATTPTTAMPSHLQNTTRRRSPWTCGSTWSSVWASWASG